MTDVKLKPRFAKTSRPVALDKDEVLSLVFDHVNAIRELADDVSGESDGQVHRTADALKTIERKAKRASDLIGALPTEDDP
jgi:hypothetical protein